MVPAAQVSHLNIHYMPHPHLHAFLAHQGSTGPRMSSFRMSRISHRPLSLSEGRGSFDLRRWARHEPKRSSCAHSPAPILMPTARRACRAGEATRCNRDLLPCTADQGRSLAVQCIASAVPSRVLLRSAWLRLPHRARGSVRGTPRRKACALQQTAERPQVSAAVRLRAIRRQRRLP
jgi:hypothetical protein